MTPRPLAALASFAVLLLAFAAGPLHAAESSDPDNRNAAGEDADPPHAVIVLTNHATLGHTGEPTGYFLPEAAHPWHVFTEAGFTVSFASPAGGPAPLDPTSLDRDDPANAAFLDDPDVQRALDHTTPLDEIDPANVDALVFAGGHGTMWDLPANPVVANAIVSVHDAGGVVAAVCHGPACFVGVVTESGRPFVEGRRLAAFTDNEERAAAKAAVVPFLLETRHRELGAEVITAPNWREQVVVDGRLVTGQNPASADKMAREVVRVVRER
mgnify:FL=1